MRKEHKEKSGGLSAKGRKFYNAQGMNLKPGVKGPANTPQKKKRKGMYLIRAFSNPSGPMKNEKGEPTRLALSANPWGEPVPQTRASALKLARKGRRLLAQYKAQKAA
jgi:hypothetical protein